MDALQCRLFCLIDGFRAGLEALEEIMISLNCLSTYRLGDVVVCGVGAIMFLTLTITLENKFLAKFFNWSEKQKGRIMDRSFEKRSGLANIAGILMAISFLAWGLAQLLPEFAFYGYLMSGIALSGSVAVLLLFCFLILDQILREKIWAMEKIAIRQKGWRLHWSIGLLAGLAIMIGSLLAGLFCLASFVSISDLLSGRQTIWPLFSILLLSTACFAFGHALFEVHAEIDRRLNGEKAFFI